MWKKASLWFLCNENSYIIINEWLSVKLWPSNVKKHIQHNKDLVHGYNFCFPMYLFLKTAENFQWTTWTLNWGCLELDTIPYIARQEAHLFLTVLLNTILTSLQFCEEQQQILWLYNMWQTWNILSLWNVFNYEQNCPECRSHCTCVQEFPLAAALIDVTIPVLLIQWATTEHALESRNVSILAWTRSQVLTKHNRLKCVTLYFYFSMCLFKFQLKTQCCTVPEFA